MHRRDFVVSLLPAATLAGSATPAKAVRITVLKRSIQKEFQKYSFGPIPVCDRVREGQQFMVSTVPEDAPEGMCKSAWKDIRTTVASIREVGPERTVACCTDGFRPVFFLVERVG